MSGVAANLLISVAFSAGASSILWLWYHRRRDWPKSWVMLLVSTAMLACGGSRLAHAFFDSTNDPAIVVLSDWISGGTALVGAALLPFAVRTLRALPTPAEAEAATKAQERAEFAIVKLQWERERSQWLVGEVDRRKRQITELSNLLQATTLPESLKERILDVVQESRA